MFVFHQWEDINATTLWNNVSIWRDLRRCTTDNLTTSRCVTMQTKHLDALWSYDVDRTVKNAGAERKWGKSFFKYWDRLPSRVMLPMWKMDSVVSKRENLLGFYPEGSEMFVEDGKQVKPYAVELLEAASIVLFGPSNSVPPLILEQGITVRGSQNIRIQARGVLI